MIYVSPGLTWIDQEWNNIIHCDHQLTDQQMNMLREDIGQDEHWSMALAR